MGPYLAQYEIISPKPEGNPEGGAPGISRGLRQYFIFHSSTASNNAQAHWGRHLIENPGNKVFKQSI